MSAAVSPRPGGGPIFANGTGPLNMNGSGVGQSPLPPPPPSSIPQTPGTKANGGSMHTSTGSGSAPAAAAAATAKIVRKKLNGYVGFANLPNQVHRKSVRRGFQFTLLVVGEGGLGKSTLVNTLFQTQLFPDKNSGPEPLEVGTFGTRVEQVQADIEEGGVRLRLTVLTTPGFGDSINNSDSWKPILTTIEQRFQDYLDKETQVNRSKILDNRVHACLYFLQPTGHALRRLDLETMKRLSSRVNLIPVIAKSDTMTEEEVLLFKQRIIRDVAHHNIRIYQPPFYENEDEETIAENEEILSKMPFAIVGATNEVMTPDGRRVRGRKYPWGVIEVEDESHCDFVKLRQLLIRTHLEELRDQTNKLLYENYRTSRMLSQGIEQKDTVFEEVNPADKMAAARAVHDAKLAKMEADMRQVFQQKVAEKEEKLKASEEELYARHREMKEALERQRQELEARKSRIETGRPQTPEKVTIPPKKKGFSLR